MSTPDEDVPPELLDEANAYLDGELDEADHALFEERLRSEVLTRRALIDVLTMRSMVVTDPLNRVRIQA